MGTDWDSARNTDPYYISAAEEQKIIDEELEMTSATPKPRAGEHTKAAALYELIADYRHLAWPEDDRIVEAMRLDLIERALREHSSKMKALEAERDSLRERERELVATLLDIARDCEAIAEDERDAGYKGTFASIASQARGVLAKARP